MLFKLLTLPISAPVSGFKFVLEQLQNVAEAELYDVDRIREQLLLLQLRLDEGELTEEEYVEQEAEIIARLREARARPRAQVSGTDEPVTYVIEGHGRED